MSLFFFEFPKDAFSFLGLASGHYIAGFLADVKGRRLPMVLSFLGTVLCCLFMTLATGYSAVCMLRLVHGACCGLGVPAAMSMIAETFPASWRRFVFVLFWSSTALGELYACCGLVLFMPQLLEECCWKQAILWSSLPALLMLIFSVAKMQDSPHWLAVHGRLIEARIVLDHMAAMNKKQEVLRKLGPPPVHDFSNMYHAGIMARDVSAGRASPPPSAHQILRILLQPDMLKLVLLFSVLASVGNIETFGMSNVWPEMLRQAEHEHAEHGFAPAQKLAMLVSMGVPVGILCAFISFAKAAAHKTYIAVAGLTGFASLCCAALLQNRSVLLPAMLLTHMCGTLEYSVSMIFCEESFPTDIRASATGIVIFWGTLWSVASPLLLTAVGEPGFLAFAGFAFLLAALAVLPLQETQGAELKDFVEQEASEEVEEREDGESDEVSEDEIYAPDHLSLAFVNGTIGAVLEVKLLFLLLGAVPGVSFTSFYSSVGFLMDRCKDRSFFVKEMLVGNGTVVAGLLLLPSIFSFMNRRLGIATSLALRLIASTLCLCLVDILMAFPEDEDLMLALGFAQGLLNVMVLNTSFSLAAGLNNCRSWLQLGFAAGALLPILTTPFTGFGPRSPLTSRLAFYLPPGLFCLMAAILYTIYHISVTRVLSSPPDNGNLADLARAYSQQDSRAATSEVADPPLASPADSSRFFPHNKRTVMACTLVLGYQFAAYFFAGLFPFLGDPTAAFTLYLYMITGDMVGNLMVFVWAAVVDLPSLESRLRGDGGGGELAKVTFFSLAALSFLAMGLGLAGAEGALEAVQRKELPLPTQLVFCTFLFGAFSKGGLEGFCPQVVRARLLGVLLGLLTALICCFTLLKNLNEPPKLAAHDHVDAPLTLSALNTLTGALGRPKLQAEVAHDGSILSILRRES